ncbi:hypothetical protein [Chitinimonas lacunae]|uniref:GspL cytoplasmic actin-ATPase-like domain-containing protein n=1 Tax=Chitinimonas lacunae TaxID=1963018 RepID=A0ABV8MR46_9NEIS
MDLLLRLDPAALHLLRRTPDGLQQLGRFAADPIGRAALLAWASDWRGLVLELLLDLPEERFALNELPRLNWRDRGRLLARRLYRLGDGSPFGRSWRLGSGRGWQLATLAAPYGLRAWLDLLAEAGLRPATLRSTALTLASAIAAQQRENRFLLVYRHERGYRHSLVEAGGIRYSRWVEGNNPPWLEISHTRDHLASLPDWSGQTVLPVLLLGVVESEAAVEAAPKVALNPASCLASASEAAWGMGPEALPTPVLVTTPATRLERTATGRLSSIAAEMREDALLSVWPTLPGLCWQRVAGTPEHWLCQSLARRCDHYLPDEWRPGWSPYWTAGGGLMSLTLLSLAATWGAQGWSWQQAARMVAPAAVMSEAERTTFPAPVPDGWAIDAAWARLARVEAAHPGLRLNDLNWRREPSGPVLLLTVRGAGPADPAGFAAAVESLRAALAQLGAVALRESSVPLRTGATLRLGEGSTGEAVLEWRPA